MKKTYKAVLRSSLVMLSLLALAVAGSGVAQAQECIARGTSVMARAEGITEAVGAIDLRCAEPMGLGFDSPEVLEITVELNTRITSVINNDLEVQNLMYTNLTGATTQDFEPTATDDVGPATLSEDGSTITWKIMSDTVTLGTSGATGFQVTIEGIKANAATLGNGEDITAVVSVGGGVVHSGALKLADVTTGLVVEVEIADVLQCETDTESEAVVVTIQEGFVNSIMDENEFLVTFSGIPEGVTVRVPRTEAELDAENNPDVDDELAAASFGLMLKEDSRTSGYTIDEDDAMMAIVDLSLAGSGGVVYEVIDGTTGITDPDEWVKLMVTFTWEAGDVTDSGEVAVSFEPVSTMGGDTFMDDGAPPERYVASGSQTIIEVNPCLTTLLFPFVTNQLTFNTGLVITNASVESGSCTINYSGANAPGDMTSQPIAGGAQWIDLVSNIAQGFQGYITATCAFRDAHGFAFLTDDYGSGAPTLAQGYLAVCISDVCPGD